MNALAWVGGLKIEDIALLKQKKKKRLLRKFARMSLAFSAELLKFNVLYRLFPNSKMTTGTLLARTRRYVSQRA